MGFRLRGIQAAELGGQGALWSDHVLVGEANPIKLGLHEKGRT